MYDQSHDFGDMYVFSLRDACRTISGVENGHVYPSDYALRFSRRTDHPATHHAVVDELRQRFSTEWPYLLGVLFAHREACMLAALRVLDRALGNPKVTRAGLRREMLAALAAIAERGPEAIGPRHGSVD